MDCGPTARHAAVRHASRADAGGPDPRIEPFAVRGRQSAAGGPVSQAAVPAPDRRRSSPAAASRLQATAPVRCASARRRWPRRSASVSGPMRIRRSRRTRNPSASSIRRMCRLPRPARRAGRRFAGPGCFRHDIHGPQDFVPRRHARAHRVDFHRGGRPVGPHAVFLFHLVAGMGKRVGEFTIVGEQDQPFAVVVEAADGVEPQTRIGTHPYAPFHDGGTARRIVRCAQDSGRLVRQIGAVGLGPDGTPVQLNPLPGGIHPGSQLRHDHPIHPHAAGADEFLAVPARPRPRRPGLRRRMRAGGRTSCAPPGWEAENPVFHTVEKSAFSTVENRQNLAAAPRRSGGRDTAPTRISGRRKSGGGGAVKTRGRPVRGWMISRTWAWSILAGDFPIRGQAVPARP